MRVPLCLHLHLPVSLMEVLPTLCSVCCAPTAEAEVCSIWLIGRVTVLRRVPGFLLATSSTSGSSPSSINDIPTNPPGPQGLWRTPAGDLLLCFHLTPQMKRSHPGTRRSQTWRCIKPGSSLSSLHSPTRWFGSSSWDSGTASKPMNTTNIHTTELCFHPPFVFESAKGIIKRTLQAVPVVQCNIWVPTHPL